MAFFWKIEEVVSTEGHYIVLPPLFDFHDESLAAAEACKYPDARAVLYRTGLGSDGPDRVVPFRRATLLAS